MASSQGTRVAVADKIGKIVHISRKEGGTNRESECAPGADRGVGAERNAARPSSDSHSFG